MSGPTKRNGENGDRVDARVTESQVNDDAVADELSDEAFDAYLQRGSTVSQSYRAIEHEEPPTQLDATILSRAQAELRRNTSQKYRHWKKWTVPVALAASTVMAISIVLESGMQHEVRSVASEEMLQRERRVTSEPARDAAGPEAAQSPSFASAPNGESDFAFAPSAPAAAPSEMAEEQDKLLALDAPSPAPPQANVSGDALAVRAARDAEEKEATERKASAMRELNAARAQSAERSESPALAASPVRQESSTQSDGAAQPEMRVMAKQIQTQASQREPAAWLEAIRELREAGKVEEADREWRAFKAAYADFEVAVDDIARPVDERD